MVRSVLVHDPAGRWRLFRQQQWMAEVRRNIEASSWTKFHLDMDEPVYLQMLKSEDQWASLTETEILKVIRIHGGLCLNPPTTQVEEGLTAGL